MISDSYHIGLAVPVARIGPQRGYPVGQKELHPMPQFDLPLAELRTYSPDLAVPEDLDAFWKATLAESRAFPLAVT